MSSSTDDNVYIKRGTRYTPFGLRYNERYLPDGIWYVHHREHSYGHTNVDHYLSGLFKVGEDPKTIDIPKLCSMQTYVDYVLHHPEMQKLMDSSQFSFMELVSKIVALVVNLNDEIHERAHDNQRPKRDPPSF